MNSYFEDGFIKFSSGSLGADLEDINQLLARVLGINRNDSAFFEEVHLKLIKIYKDKDLYFGLLKSFTNSPIVQSLANNSDLIKFVKNCGVQEPSLVTPPILHVVSDNLILDREKVFTPPHQDVISTKGSVGQVVIWVPLHSISTDNYGIQVYPGSHKLGILEIDESSFGHTVKTKEIQNLQSQYIELDFGSAMIFSQYLIHFTHSVGKFRMAISFRFNDLTDKDWAKRKYFVPFNRSVVKDVFQDNRHIAPPNFEIKR